MTTVAADGSSVPANLPDLVTVENGKATTTSLKVAEVFGKDHKNVMQSIEQLDCSEEFRKLNFQLSSYSVPNNRRRYPMYLMTRDGFSPRHVCDALGIAWTSQRVKIMEDQVLSRCVTEIVTRDSLGRKQKMSMLPIEYANGWLFMEDAFRKSKRVLLPVWPK